jgi:predicted SAM-dependent methyltransferase
VTRLPNLSRLLTKARKVASRYGIGPGSKQPPAEYIARGGDLSRLHLGCGQVHIPGWCNVDGLATGATDVIADLRTLEGIPDACADMVYACHVLEHFSHVDIVPILRRWQQVLKPRGEIRISVPDLDAIMRVYEKNIAHFQVPGHSPWIGLIYGGQKDKYDYHKTGFNFCWLKHLLEQVSFQDVERYPNAPHFVPGVIDNSLGTEPFGEFYSLNVKARKR